MNKNHTYNALVIESNIKLLEPFASDLTAFFERGKTMSLFKKMPLKDDVETTKLRLSEGRYLLRPCGVDFKKNECNQLAMELLDLLKTHLEGRERDSRDRPNDLILVTCCFPVPHRKHGKTRRRSDL